MGWQAVPERTARDPREHAIRARTASGILALALALTACTSSAADEPGSSAGDGQRASASPVAPAGAVLTRPAARSAVLDASTGPEAAAALSAHLLATSPSVVVAADEPASLERGAAVAEGLGVPLLLPAPATAEEVRRLGAEGVLTVGGTATTWARETFTERGDPSVEVAEGPRAATAEQGGGTVVLVTGAPWEAAAAATARAVGAQVLTVPSGDPRADGAVVEALHAAAPQHVVGLGPAFAAQDVFAGRVETAVTGAQVPGGGQLPLEGRRLIALYGHPNTPSLGLMGEQPLEETLARARELAGRYDGLDERPAVPTLEIITTVASGSPGPDGNYSNEVDPAELEPWVDAAGAAGVSVVLDLQPGRSDFLTQAKRYESLLRRPHVGLALDPEWRLAPGQVHLRQIGSVGAGEVNAVGDWLAQLVRENALPQKVFLLHQFRTSMVRDRETVDTGRDELVTVVHADGHGTPGMKEATYGVLTSQGPPGLVWGWKNFIDEDDPTFTPAETVAVDPSPVFVSYQ
ncbi:hypothetical protein MO973_16725 [Paenibacillus sp. TRM 82003]|uniref:hypothetical protein n=1 Tax=Kineococcus sp. TRM81007 TaxID=2925831 RepID=UPI001F560F3B|nr:hypothetical protein [Kineococcus sp. TRM81007]MCI2237551.1 hypothetical protein [Kineococcus sp. TRM81007]MCI3921877.1 hypothetical protein [Paenibacillus sp. TRM 82003]